MLLALVFSLRRLQHCIPMQHMYSTVVLKFATIANANANANGGKCTGIVFIMVANAHALYSH
jgi:hypothetical protein